MTMQDRAAAEAERLGELVRAGQYLVQKAELYVAAVEAYDEAAMLVAGGARYEHLRAAKGHLEHSSLMLTGALDDAKETMRRAKLMSPALSHTNDAAESGRSITQ